MGQIEDFDLREEQLISMTISFKPRHDHQVARIRMLDDSSYGPHIQSSVCLIKSSNKRLPLLSAPYALHKVFSHISRPTSKSMTGTFYTITSWVSHAFIVTMPRKHTL